jgi:TPR repeat protein
MAYMEGKGVPKDEQEAKDWLQRARMNGWDENEKIEDFPAVEE